MISLTLLKNVETSLPKFDKSKRLGARLHPLHPQSPSSYTIVLISYVNYTLKHSFFSNSAFHAKSPDTCSSFIHFDIPHKQRQRLLLFCV